MYHRLISTLINSQTTGCEQRGMHIAYDMGHSMGWAILAWEGGAHWHIRDGSS